MLPRMSGFELIAALRAESSDLQMVPVILLTTSGDDRSKVAFGADGEQKARPVILTPQTTSPSHSALVSSSPAPTCRSSWARSAMRWSWRSLNAPMSSASSPTVRQFPSCPANVSLDTPVGIFRCNEQGWGEYANQTWHHMSGYPTGIPIVNWGDYVIPEHQQHVYDIWTTFVSTGAERADGEFQCVTGTYVHCTMLRLEKIEGAPVSGTERMCTSLTAHSPVSWAAGSILPTVSRTRSFSRTVSKRPRSAVKRLRRRANGRRSSLTSHRQSHWCIRLAVADGPQT